MSALKRILSTVFVEDFLTRVEKAGVFAEDNGIQRAVRTLGNLVCDYVGEQLMKEEN